MLGLPLAGLMWLGGRVVREEDAAFQHRLRDLMTGQLGNVDRLVVTHFEGIARRLRSSTKLEAFDAETVRAAVRGEPLAQQMIVLDTQGKLEHPHLEEPLNQGEREFLAESRQMLLDGDLARAAGIAVGTRGRPPETQAPGTRAAQDQRPGSNQTDGWYVWYQGRGVQLIFWRRLDDGRVVAVAIERARWLADLIASLPETIPENAGPENTAPDAAGASGIGTDSARIRLVDSVGQTVYEWGRYQPEPSEVAFAESTVSQPLATWRLQAFVPQSLMSGADRSRWFQVISGIAAIGLTLLLVAAIFWRGYAQDMKNALQRVSFVNQVSHELKTPLTNIRMYADLLERDLSILDEDTARRPLTRLQVILQESQRLSRLIGNVLTFARQQRCTLQLNPRPGLLDDIVRQTVQQFAPSLARMNLHVELDLKASSPVRVDPDAVEQILVNLIGNVEKYASTGRLLKIATRLHDGTSIITVEDRGPGIPASERESVFRPFYRLSDRIEDAAGTGIGLAIVRELSRLHGGDTRIVDAECGACFEVTLKSEPDQSVAPDALDRPHHRAADATATEGTKP